MAKNAAQAVMVLDAVGLLLCVGFFLVGVIRFHSLPLKPVAILFLDLYCLASDPDSNQPSDKRFQAEGQMEGCVSRMPKRDENCDVDRGGSCVRAI